MKGIARVAAVPIPGCAISIRHLRFFGCMRLPIWDTGGLKPGGAPLVLIGGNAVEGLMSCGSRGGPWGLLVVWGPVKGHGGYTGLEMYGPCSLVLLPGPLGVSSARWSLSPDCTLATSASAFVCPQESGIKH